MAESLTIQRESDSTPIGVRSAEPSASNKDVGKRLEAMIVEESGEEHVEPPAKKSLAFKLAFVGLAATSFVFQLDATGLRIALPVSYQTHTLFQHKKYG